MTKTDVALILWRADSPEHAAKVREFVGMNPAGIPDECGLCVTDGPQAIYSNVNFGAMSGAVYIAFGEDGMEPLDVRNIEAFASRFPCETETYLGAAEDFLQTKVIRPPQFRAVA